MISTVSGSIPSAECTRVFYNNDKLALVLMDVLRQNGMRVPEDLSIVGVDNCELASVTALTSIVHPLEQLGEAAARLLLTMIQGGQGKIFYSRPSWYPGIRSSEF